MDAGRKKQLVNEYKQRTIVGGIYRITNTRSGMFLLDHTPNIQAKNNSFDFMTAAGFCPDYRLKKDFDAWGGQVFKFEIIETLEKKKDQSQDAFVTDLATLAQMHRDKTDSTKAY
jgi:hypothetical protein